MTLKEKVSSKLSETRAVSPVIVVILMVSITVILAAVIGTFVMGLGNSVSKTTPQASLSVSATASSNTISIEHAGGDALHSDRTKIVVDIDGASQTIGASSSDSTLTVGDTSIFNFSTNSAAPTSGWTAYDPPTSSSFNSGAVITVKIIDTDSQKIIYKTQVTA